MDPSIPCKICSDKSAGIHYGVPSCEACKSFFKRCNQKPPEPNKCRNAGKCTIVPARRNNCAECRYMKCLTIGMSINNIKTGRYSAKQLEESRRAAEKHKRREELEKTGFYVDHKLSNTEIEDVCKKMVEMRRLAIAIIRKRMSVKYHRFLRTNFFNKDLPLKERLEASFKHRKPEFFKNIVVQITKDIPGFSSIRPEDQFELIKVNRIDFRITYQALKIDDYGSYIILNDQFKILMKDVEEAATIPDELTEKSRSMTKKLEVMGLTEEERVILSALSLTNTDRSMKIEDKVRIEKVQNNLLQCLDYIINKSYGNEKGSRLAKLLTLLADLRTCSDDLIKYKHDIVLQNPDVEFPESLRELWYSELQEAYDMDKIRSELKKINLDFISQEQMPDKLDDELATLDRELEFNNFDTSYFPFDIDTIFQ